MSDSKQTIEISLSEYMFLRCRDEELSRLINGGVYKWQWYAESMHGEKNECTMKEFQQNLYDEYNYKHTLNRRYRE